MALQRLNVQYVIVRNEQTGQVTEVITYSGAHQIGGVGGVENGVVVELRGQFPATVTGADAAAKHADAEAKAKAEIRLKLDEIKLAV